MHRLAIAGALVGFASLALVATRPSRGGEQDPMLARVGAEMFRQYCAACHGTNGEGDGPVAASLTKKPADLTHIAARHGGQFPEADVTRWIDGRFDVAAHGTREMPVWGRTFSESAPRIGNPDEVVRGQLIALVEYLKTIQKK